MCMHNSERNKQHYMLKATRLLAPFYLPTPQKKAI